MSKHEQPSLLEEVRALREEIRQVAGFILELKRDYSVLEDKIELNSSDVLRLLGISEASLAGESLMQYLIATYLVIMSSIPSRGFTLLSKQAELLSTKAFAGSKPCKR